ncbi:MAG: hypothetical protein HOO96_02500 [Polyangiaceae bacterium]|nr:hypothetical protein [Polyangiaceae bacterium]
MTRYYERYYNADPMDELDEQVALEGGTYLVEDGGPMRRYRRFVDGELAVAIYAGWADPAEPLLELARRREGVEAEIYSPVEVLADGGKRWRTWYVDEVGRITKSLEPEYARDGRRVKETLRGADGELISSTIYHYDKNDQLLELVTHADGAVTSRQDAW